MKQSYLPQWSLSSTRSKKTLTTLNHESKELNAHSAQTDAIIVPTSRSSHYTDWAIDLASQTGSYLIAMCSGKASAWEITNRANTAKVCGMAIDIPLKYKHKLLTFKTNLFPEALYGRQTNDLYIKRNLGLLIAHLAGWKKIFFLDDDITGITKSEMELAASTLSDKAIAGFPSTNFPDNSVVRHAERLGGSEPGVALSASAMMVNVTKATGFWPAIYNADWLFPYDSRRSSNVKVFEPALQEPYNPFLSPQRAASEEFGDFLAEGITHLMKCGIACTEATVSDWKDLFALRNESIRNIRQQIMIVRPSNLDCVLASLQAAETQLNEIDPVRCLVYISTWRDDLDLWLNRLDKLNIRASPALAIEQLGLNLSYFSFKKSDF